MLYTLENLKNKVELGKTFILKKDDKCPELDNLPSAGPNACISGMRKLYWGLNSKIVKKGAYIYKID